MMESFTSSQGKAHTYNYDSLLNAGQRKPSPEIHKLAVIFPTYLSDSGFGRNQTYILVKP